MIGGKNLSFCKSRPLTNKKANIKTHKYGLAIIGWKELYLNISKMAHGALLKGYENFQIRQIARGLEVFLFNKKLYLL